MPKLLLALLVLAAVVPASAQQQGHEHHAMPENAPMHEGHGDHHQHHQHHDHHQHHQSEPTGHEGHGDHSSHNHSVGPAGATYDLRWLDAMNQHHTGALRMSEYVFGIGAPGPAHLAHSIWRDQATEIKAMIRWRKAWYPQAPVYPVSLKPGGDPDAMSGLQRMSDEQIAMMQMVGTPPASGEQVDWFLEGMLYHHGGALEMAHEALDRSSNTTIRRLSRDIILAQRQEIILLRRMLASRGLSKPSYYNYDHLFRLS